jgi:hypothetical protein
MRLTIAILMFALCAVPAAAECPPLTKANVFIAMSGSFQVGDPLTLAVHSFAYDLACGPHEYRWTFSDAYVATGREVTRVLMHPLDVTVEVRNPISSVLLSTSIRTIGHEPWPMIVQRRSRNAFRFSTAWSGDVTWDFGDGNTATGRMVEHEYAAAPRTYRVTIRSSGGARHSQDVNVVGTRRRAARH